MEKIKSFFEQKDAFARKCGIELLEVGIGTAKAKVKLEPDHMNGVAIAHGGIIFTLADFVFAAASNSHGTVAVAINANISYLKAAQGGVLFAEAREISCSRKIASYAIDVTDEDGNKIAIFQGMVYRKDAPLIP
ncbi:MAG: PaaI family thioesterase [Phycisphaerales bacterium]|jgi:acyl-CoA thioesterase